MPVLSDAASSIIVIRNVHMLDSQWLFHARAASSIGRGGLTPGPNTLFLRLYYLRSCLARALAWNETSVVCHLHFKLRVVMLHRAHIFFS